MSVFVKHQSLSREPHRIVAQAQEHWFLTLTVLLISISLQSENGNVNYHLNCLQIHRMEELAGPLHTCDICEYVTPRPDLMAKHRQDLSLLSRPFVKIAWSRRFVAYRYFGFYVEKANRIGIQLKMKK
jgi:hypothetical protein